LYHRGWIIELGAVAVRFVFVQFLQVDLDVQAPLGSVMQLKDGHSSSETRYRQQQGVQVKMVSGREQEGMREDECDERKYFAVRRDQAQPSGHKAQIHFDNGSDERREHVTGSGDGYELHKMTQKTFKLVKANWF
jgi:hypothetical protein